MKARILIYLCIILLSGCGKSGNFTIDGLVSDNSLNGEYIYMQKIIDNQLVNVDSVMVSGSKFMFKGKIDSAEIRELNFRKSNGLLNPLVFILEPGNMDAVIDTLSYMTGTLNNDKLSEYYKQRWAISHNMQVLMKNYQLESMNPSVSDSVLISYQGRYDLLRKQMEQVSYQFCMLNYDNVAGALIFLQSYPYFTSQEVMEILGAATHRFKNVEGVGIISAQMQEEAKVAVGNPFVNLELRNTEGNVVMLSDYVGRGNWVLLDFWASWCSPCRKEFGYLKKAYQTYGPKGFNIIGISFDKSKSDWLKCISANKLDWMQLSDLQGWDSEAASAYAIQAIPMTILIDPQGKIVEKGLRQEMLLSRLAEIYDKKQ